MRVVEYKTITSVDCATLDAEINKLLAQGYQLYGSPYAVGGGGQGIMAQALIKHGLRDPMAPIEITQTSVVQP